MDSCAGRLKRILANKEMTDIPPGWRQNTSESRLVFFHHRTAEMIIIVYISSSSKGSKLFVTVKPVVTKPTDCVPLERHAIKCDRCIGNDIKSGFGSHHSLVPDRLLMRITTISCLPPLRNMFLWAGGVTVTQIDCEVGIDKEHLFLLLKTSGEVAFKTSPFVF